MRKTKVLIAVLVAILLIATTTVVNAGAGYLFELEDYLNSAHTICGKSYELTAAQKQVVTELFEKGNITSEQAGSALHKLESAVSALNSTGASSLSEVSKEIQTSVISLVTGAGADIGLSVKVNTDSNVVTVVDSNGVTLASASYVTDESGNVSLSSATASSSNGNGVLEGNNQLYNVNSCVDLTFRFDVDYSYFTNGGKVYMDGQLVDPSNYTSKSGSTIISFKYDYAKNLSLGSHTVKVEFTNGKSLSSTFRTTGGGSGNGGSVAGSAATGTATSGSSFIYTGSSSILLATFSLLATAVISVVFVKKVVLK